ncbi:MAG TPA: protein kinase, partial [Polyangia bacterium]|nr:protein kinase [Polyangia bacterium]
MSLQARYTILRKIADGGTAEIFLATQKGVHGFEKPVVLKRIFSAYYADPQFRDMLVNEAHIAMSLNHSNIVQVLDLGEDEGQYILALELVDGWTLDSVMRRVRAARSTIRPALALYITAEVCRALAYAHAKTGTDGNPLGIVHRDISPQNVLLSEQGEVKLTDFGIAIAHNQRDAASGSDKLIRGKIAYMSPEQASGAPMDARSDLFSVGTMLYVMACGRYPFDAPTDLGVLLLVKSDEYVPPEVARPGINAELARILKKAMAKDPAERYQRADDMLMDVEQVMRSQFVAVGQTELKRWLADLSVRDGVPVLTKAPAIASSAQSGRIIGPPLESGPIPASGPRMPPPPSAAARAVSTVNRPAPPPAALSVKRTRPIPPTGSGPLQRSPGSSEAAHTAPTRELKVFDPAAAAAAEGTPTPPKGTAIPEPIGTVTTSAPIIEPTPLPADPVAAFRAARRTSASMATLGGSGRPTTGSHPVVVTPPPPVSTDVVAPPPVAAEILAAINAPTKNTPFLSLFPQPAPPAQAAESAAPPSSDDAQTAGRRKLPLAWIGGGLAGVVALVLSVRACSSGPAERQTEKKPSVAAVAPSAPTPVVQ